MNPLTESLQGELLGARSGDRAGPDLRIVFAIISTGLFMGAVDLTIVATALTAIQKGLHSTINWTGWALTIYGICTVTALPIAGKLCAQFGRRRMFVLGVALFSVTSLACGFSTNIYLLIVFRALQALGGGAIQPAAAGIVADLFGPRRARAISMFALVGSAGQVAGPVAGGVIVGFLSWRWIFFVNVPIGAILIAAALRFVPASSSRTSMRADVVGLLLMSIGLLSAVFGVTELGGKLTKIYDPIVVVPGALAVLLLWGFFRHERRDPAPFIPEHLLLGKGFARMNAINLLHGMVTFGVISLAPLYAFNRFHVAMLEGSTILSARAVGMVAIGGFAALALRRTGYRLPMAVGFGVIALGNLALSVTPRFGISPMLWICGCAAVAGLGLGTVNPAASNACMFLEPEQAAAITSLRSMFINLGVIVSVSITTAILNRAGDPGIAQTRVFWAAAAVIALVILPMIRGVPEHRGDW